MKEQNTSLMVKQKDSSSIVIRHTGSFAQPLEGVTICFNNLDSSIEIMGDSSSKLSEGDNSVSLDNLFEHSIEAGSQREPGTKTIYFISGNFEGTVEMKLKSGTNEMILDKSGVSVNSS